MGQLTVNPPTKTKSFLDSLKREERTGVLFPRFFTAKLEAGKTPYDQINWELRTASIGSGGGSVIFEQRDVEVPADWSQTATNIVASKYFHGRMGSPERETSVAQLVHRVVDTIADWGLADNYFKTKEEGENFRFELAHLMLTQKACFNSPVWFNVGVRESRGYGFYFDEDTQVVKKLAPGETRPQCSACFINSVGDTLESILDLAKTEGMLFKWGSGTGTNLSPIREENAHLWGGGRASGPLSFMKGFDAFAGVIKSGGKTRRAAKMVILNSDHPDVEGFIWCKAKEEKKAHTLIDAGYDASLDGEAYGSVFFQNANNSVRATDDFMQAVVDDADWWTRSVANGQPVNRYKARELMRQIADATHQCGDPGMQFDTTVNRWHTSQKTGRINASNPCVTGDTLVATGDGWQPISKLVGNSALIYGADGQPHFVSSIFPTGTKQVFRLHTRSGFELRLTADHKVLTANRGDVPASEMQEGDRVRLQGAGFGRRALSESLAVAIGVAVGDGCLSRSEASGNLQEIITLVMAADEADVLRNIAGELNTQKQALKAVGSVGRNDQVAVTSATGSSTSCLAFSSRPVVDLFKQFAVLDQGSEGKQFMPDVYELDRASLARVLRGLFTADGTVANYGDKSQYISLDSVSKTLLKQAQVLLLSFGIKAKLYCDRRGGNLRSMMPDGRGGSKEYPVKELYSLRISRSSRFIFEREIGFDPASPKAAELAAMNRDFAAYHDTLTDEIVGVEPLGEEPVFDLTEPVTSHFSANGLLVHNCSEYMFLDDSACNLSSLNLMRFVGANGSFDVEAFRHAVDTMILAQEIIVGNASYPTEKIAKNSHDFRPLGLGFANLGAMLMSLGLPYDSDAGRDFAGAISAIMCGQAYLTSARIAEAVGPCPGYAENEESFLDVIRMHWNAASKLDGKHVPAAMYKAAEECWRKAYELGAYTGYRNSQTTVIAPTGTIGFMMDCDTTGIEPDLALVKYKKLVGGGVIKIVNNTVPQALIKLSYTPEQTEAIVAHIDSTGTIEGAPALKPEHLAVFDCSFRPQNGVRFIHHNGHIHMMAAVQPFVSGAISKTINMPEESTVEDVMEAYIESWKLGLKAVAIYRDGSKRVQPLSSGTGSKSEKKAAAAVAAAAAPTIQIVEKVVPKPFRRKLPDERQSLTHKFSIGGHEGYITVGLYEDGTPGEVFISMAKEGSTISGLMDTLATSISYGLQYGVPLKFFVDKFSHVRFEPSGWTGNQQVPYAKSIIDYIFRWLGLRFLGIVEHNEAGDTPKLRPTEPEPQQALAFDASESYGDAPLCSECGSFMTRNGSCYKCENCGGTSGCS